MSDGKKLFRAIIEHGSPRTLLDVSEDLFAGQEEETALYQQLMSYVRQYGVLPQVETFHERTRIALPEAPEPLRYYLDKVHSNFLFQHIKSSFAAEYGTALRAANPYRIIELMETTLSVARRRRRVDSAVNIRQLLIGAMDDYAQAQSCGGNTGVPTGWPTLDEVTYGYQPGDLITWVAASGMGKTYSLLHQAYESWRAGYRSLVLTTELALKQVGRRFAGMLGGVNPDMLRRVQLSTRKQMAMRQQFEAIPFHDGDRLNIFYTTMVGRVTALDSLVMEFAPDIVYIDSFYLLKPDVGNRSMSKIERVPMVVEELKNITLIRDIPICITTQYNRQAGATGKQGGVENIGLTDSLRTDSSLIISIYPGESPNEKTQRHIKLLKGREGEEAEFDINYKFNPPDFSEIPRSEVGIPDWESETETVNLDEEV